jgi:hypothetical protein
MAVKISGLKPTVTCPAELFLPDDNGTFHVHKFDTIFKRLPEGERDELHKRYTLGYVVEVPAPKADAAPTQEHRRLSNAELLDKVVAGWGGMLDENGNAVPYSHEERRSTNQAYPGLEQAMAVCWFDHLFVNQGAAAQKNSAAPSGTTSAETARAAT